ncbi:MAG: M20/M25/M40 family metallo-hydrolase [Flavobacteriales bacterium]|nr:M20/M25/M40 family metallo-hydrolase [Flavobacteriales bacterium]MDW8410986.1 M20/M25/M40 family metallo-hydrolase [Flavobacteriales bacterium]
MWGGKALLLSLYGTCIFLSATGQDPADSIFIRKIFDIALENLESYTWLKELCSIAPKRLSNYADYFKAVAWAEEKGLKWMGLTVERQPVWVPNWYRGNPEVALLEVSGRTFPLNAAALGGSAAGHVRASVVGFATLEALELAPTSLVQGKIVFINQGFDPHPVETGTSYGMAVGSRRNGPAVAARKGALACLIRSMTHARDDYPHTGMTVFPDSVTPIPALALGMVSADTLWAVIKSQKEHTLFIETFCRQGPDTLSFNVVGEWKGKEKPGEFIVVGGHLDAWDTGSGAHDDGAGCIHAMMALRLLQKAGYTPRRTLRFVLFANEENGLRGAEVYYKLSYQRGEVHVAALESDAGGFTPRGFRYENNPTRAALLQDFLPLLMPYGISFFRPGGSGADLIPFRKETDCLLLGYSPDSQRYFDHHHAATDTPEHVHPRELELGSACIAALIYLLDKYLP